MTRVLTWNGRDLPMELEDLPAGRYIVESVDDAVPLTPDEEEGLRQTMRSIAEGRSVSADEVRRRLASRRDR